MLTHQNCKQQNPPLTKHFSRQQSALLREISPSNQQLESSCEEQKIRQKPLEKESAIDQIKDEFEGGLQNVKSALCPSIRDQRMNHYLKSCGPLLEVGQSLCKQAKADLDFRNHAIVAGAPMAFGWMPVTLKRCDINGEIERNGKTRFWMRLMSTHRKIQKNW